MDISLHVYLHVIVRLAVQKAGLLEEQSEGDVGGKDGEDDEAGHDDMEARELLEGGLVVDVD